MDMCKATPALIDEGREIGEREDVKKKEFSKERCLVQTLSMN